MESAKAAGYLPDETILRQVKYLNNGVEGDHMPMKRLIAPGLGFWSFNTARKTIQGYEVMRMIKKGQVQQPENRPLVKLDLSIYFSGLLLRANDSPESFSLQRFRFLHQSR